jgi:predicted nucleic acid-binding Zn ribbon protein
MPPLGAPRPSRRQQVLAQWRGYDLTPLEKARADAAKRVGDVTQQALARKLHIDAQVVKVWNELLDANIVAHAQPVGLRRGTLFVTVDSSAWLSEIVRYRRKEILDQLQNSFGREFIARISFRVG